MSKSRVGIIFVLVCLATSITFAQSFFSSTPTTDTKATTLIPQPLSADDFKKLTQQQNQTTQSQLTQQVTKTLAQQPFPLPQPPADTPPTTNNNAVNSVVPAAPITSVDSTTPTDNSATATNNQTAAAAPAPQSTDQPYTGYQSPSINNGKNGGGSSSQTGWGIKY